MISGLVFVVWEFHSLVTVSLSGSYTHVCWPVVPGIVQIGEWQRGIETRWVKRQRGAMPKSYKKPVCTKNLNLWRVEVWWAERASEIRL